MGNHKAEKYQKVEKRIGINSSVRIYGIKEPIII
jgi:hypothetical protein